MVDLARKNSKEKTSAELEPLLEVDALKNPTQMSDSLATRLGCKEYFGALSGADVDLSGTVSGVARAVFIPYQTQSGAWRLRFNISVNWSSSTTATVTLSGVTFKNTGGYFQTVASNPLSSVDWTYSYADPGTDDVYFRSGSAQTGGNFSGDVELESKPTWAL